MLFFWQRNAKISAENSLRAFAFELDNRLSQLEIEVLNTTYQSEPAIQMEMNVQFGLQKIVLIQILTTEGTIFASEAVSDINTPIKFASAQYVRDYYNDMAGVVLQRKKTTCVGFAAVSLLLASELVKKPDYRNIKVQICEFQNYGHTFVRLIYQGYTLFYDPWAQRCLSSTPNTPMLIEEAEFGQHYRKIMRLVLRQPRQTIVHFNQLMSYHSLFRRLGEPEENKNTDFSYSIVCSSDSKFFSNPAKIILEPSATQANCLGSCLR